MWEQITVATLLEDVVVADSEVMVERVEEDEVHVVVMIGKVANGGKSSRR